MFAEAFAVIRGNDNQGLIPPPFALQRFRKSTQQLIDGRHFSVIRAQLIRPVDVEQMHEYENRLALVGRHPALGREQHQRPRPAFAHRVGVVRAACEKHRPRELRKRLEAERTVVGVEALVEAQLPLQKNAADERRRLIAMAFQHGGKRREIRRYMARVFLHAVLEWICGRHQHGMRGQGERNLRFGVREYRAALAVCADVRRVRADVVRTQRVDGDQNDGRLRAALTCKTAERRYCEYAERTGI